MNSADITIGNLEGPIVKNYFIVPNNSTRFSFAPNKAEVLAQVGFDYLSQANIFKASASYFLFVHKSSAGIFRKKQTKIRAGKNFEDNLQ